MVYLISVCMIDSVARSMDQFIAEVDIFGIFGILYLLYRVVYLVLGMVYLILGLV